MLPEKTIYVIQVCSLREYSHRVHQFHNHQGKAKDIQEHKCLSKQFGNISSYFPAASLSSLFFTVDSVLWGCYEEKKKN